MRSWLNARKRPFRPPVFAPLLIWPDAFLQAAARKAGGGERAEERPLALISAGRPFALRQESVQSLAVRGERGGGAKGAESGCKAITANGPCGWRGICSARECPRAPEAALLAPAGRLRTGAQAADRQRGAASETGANTKGVKKAFAPVPPGHDAMDSGAKNSRFRWACARPARTVLFGAGLRTGARSLPTRRPGPGAGPAGRARGPRCGPPFRRCWRGAGRGRGWAGR